MVFVSVCFVKHTQTQASATPNKYAELLAERASMEKFISADREPKE